MTDSAAPNAIGNRTKKNVTVLVLAQAVLGAQMPMLFIIGGLAGQMLSPIACLATLPLTLIFFGSMTTAPWLSPLMQKWGRRAGFSIGCFAGMAGALLAAIGLWNDSFVLFLIGSFITGIYFSSQGFLRFAATDTATEDFRPKAISYVLAGGLAAAVIGPQLVKATSDNFVVPFLGTYLAVAAINLVGVFLFMFLDIPKPEPRQTTTTPARTRMQLLGSPEILVPMICAMVTYSLMTLVMTSTPLAVVGCGYTSGNAADVVTSHVLAMYAPSFFTGHLIARFGAQRIVSIGLFLLASAGAVALTGVNLEQFFGALILLGLGWNFGFIGATAMLTAAHRADERGTVQGLNDLMVFGCVTVASLASGGLLNCTGGDAAAGWQAVNIAMIPFLTLAGGSLIWLALRPKSPSAH